MTERGNCAQTQQLKLFCLFARCDDRNFTFSEIIRILLQMKRSLTVLFGSQTGTAEEVAERVGREAVRLHFDTEVSSLDNFDVRRLPSSSLVVYVTSTTGQVLFNYIRVLWRQVHHHILYL